MNRLLDNARRYLDAYAWKRAVPYAPSHGPHDSVRESRSLI